MNILLRGFCKEGKKESPGRDIAGSDGETMIGEACADTAQPGLRKIEMMVYAAANQSTLA